MSRIAPYLLIGLLLLCGCAPKDTQPESSAGPQDDPAARVADQRGAMDAATSPTGETPIGAEPQTQLITAEPIAPGTDSARLSPAGSDPGRVVQPVTPPLPEIMIPTDPLAESEHLIPPPTTESETVSPFGPRPSDLLAEPLTEDESAAPDTGIGRPVELDPMSGSIGGAQSHSTQLQPLQPSQPIQPSIQPLQPETVQPIQPETPSTITPPPSTSPRAHSAALAPLVPRSQPIQPEAEPVAPAPTTSNIAPVPPTIEQPAVPAAVPIDPLPQTAAPADTATEAVAPLPTESTDAAAAPPIAGPVAEPTENPDFTVVQVFYGTDRARQEAPSYGWTTYLWNYFPTALVLGLTVLLGVVAWRRPHRRKLLIGGACLALLATIGLALLATSSTISTYQTAHTDSVLYGNQRGVLEVGTCNVSIPKIHEMGQIEAPSVLRLELREDPTRHVVLSDVKSEEEAAFYEQLRQRVAQSPNREVMIFVHGYNVTFEAAAKRTGQMAYDLKFQGVPIFYSWPSQGELLQYATDENNVAWTVPHLKQFLIDVANRSEARSINLIAHSMGNRALTAALRELSYQLGENGQLFNQVILAAPDIDADVFRRDIAPRVARTARLVTLYASSNDQALIVSRTVHGYPRAGESGDNLVVLPEIETIDVSSVDTSLLGHSYYGDNRSVIDDIYYLIHQALRASSRQYLVQMQRDGVPYWIYQPEPPPSTSTSPGDVVR